MDRDESLVGKDEHRTDRKQVAIAPGALPSHTLNERVGTPKGHECWPEPPRVSQLGLEIGWEERSRTSQAVSSMALCPQSTTAAIRYQTYCTPFRQQKALRSDLTHLRVPPMLSTAGPRSTPCQWHRGKLAATRRRWEPTKQSKAKRRDDDVEIEIEG